jgi:hypothetical protein
MCRLLEGNAGRGKTLVYQWQWQKGKECQNESIIDPSLHSLLFQGTIMHD